MAKAALTPLADQVMVITGASSGIGLAIARAAAAQGASVFLISRNAEALAQIVDEIEGQGGRAGFAAVDVADDAALARAARKAVERFGRIDTWVSNAGVAIYAPLLETPLAEHRRLIDTNYFGAVNSASVAMPYLRESGGALIVIGSIAGDMPSPMMGAYTASKHALRAFVSSLRIELEHEGVPVRATLIKPSGIATPIAEHSANHQQGAARIPPPPYDPALVADAILHAATHRVRELTVGGAGRAEILFASHFPALFDRLASLIIPSLSDPTRRDRKPSNLFVPAADGAERSPVEQGRKTSLYLRAQIAPARTLALAALVGLTVAAVAGAAKKRPARRA